MSKMGIAKAMDKNEVKTVINNISKNWNRMKVNSRICRKQCGGDFTTANAPDWSVDINAHFSFEDVFTKEEIDDYSNEVFKYDSYHHCTKAGLIKFIKGLVKKGLRIECEEDVGEDDYWTWCFDIEIYKD